MAPATLTDVQHGLLRLLSGQRTPTPYARIKDMGYHKLTLYSLEERGHVASEADRWRITDQGRREVTCVR